MPSRTIKRNLLNRRSETIGHFRTEGQGLIPTAPPHIKPISIIPNQTNHINSTDINKFLKVKPKNYISFD